MSHNNSSASDPRQPLTAKPYVPPTVASQDLPINYAGFIAMIFGVAGVLFRYKLCSWLAIIFCAQSLANMQNFENDLKQVSMAMMFAIMGLASKYFGPSRPGKQS
ncbi:protein Asterix [Telopea speciosissima]|uniref:protein Asterix n=1 Tax=Telopea speciosissima TaxID=54955 RepID=UPI001CC56D7D|nr:protein Asterix [Telopea speciosissima]